MPITLTELVDSREWQYGDRESCTMHYMLTGTDDDTIALQLLLNSTPTTYGSLEREQITFEPVEVDTGANTGRWDCRVRYVAPEEVKPEVGDSSFSFDTGGGTQHVTQSLQTIQKYAPPGKTAPDFKGAVGVTHDNVEGVDIVSPVYNFSETHYINDDDVTEAYKGKLFELTGKVNDDFFKGFIAGECLFMGASGSKRGADDWEITFRFAASPNKTGLTVGDITVAAKKGWEYLWVRYADAEDVTAKAIVKVPVAAYVEKVYEEGDFSGLGIGT